MLEEILFESKNKRKLNHYIENQLEQLRFMTCGSVDDGKSTLIGRMLWEAGQVFDDQLVSLQNDSKKYQTATDDINFALLVDGLVAEREQGITIDVAYRYFSTKNRRFIVADSPGHEQYTRNMVTAASTVDLAIILVDATKGILTQTRRHAYLASLMGIKYIILAINKMDLIDYNKNQFLIIKNSFQEMVAKMGFFEIVSIPMVALKGDNVKKLSTKMPWYDDDTLMDYLETVQIKKKTLKQFVFPVQWVNRHNDFRGYAGTIAEGHLAIGDEIRVTRTGQTAHIKQIITMNHEHLHNEAGKAITIVLDKEIDVSRGDIISNNETPLQMTDKIEATLVWLAESKSLNGNSYILKIATQETIASITQINHKININNLTNEPAQSLKLNDIAVCNLKTIKPVTFDCFNNSKCLGSFILIDRYTYATVAGGIIHRSLNPSVNVYRQAFAIQQSDREKLKGHVGTVLWFTGLSGSGKSTIANALEIQLFQKQLHTYILDGDNIRQGLNKDLGFSTEDRIENMRRVAEVAKLMADAGLIVITTFISPFIQEREMAKALIGEDKFIEIYVNTPLEICEQRDTKGLYKKARKGELANMSGITSPYEPPENPIIELNTKDSTVDESVRILLDELEGLFIIKG